MLAVLLAAPGCRDLFPEFGIDDVHELLVVSAGRGDVKIIENLAKKGVDLDEPYAHSDTHWTALQAAIDRQRVDAVRVLLEWGANPDATQGANKPPLIMAKEAGNQTIVNLLINAGATPTDAFAEKLATPAPSRP